MAKPNITAARLREILDYNPETGVFTWKAVTSNRAKAGAVAGTANDGYVLIGADGHQRPAHRLAWLYVYGEMPKHDIDHINGDRSDNRIANLRDVSRSVNMQNQRRGRGSNSAGILGATWDRARGKWRAQIKVEKHRLIGRFDTLDEAHAAYLAAKRRLHEGCTI